MGRPLDARDRSLEPQSSTSSDTMRRIGNLFESMSGSIMDQKRFTHYVHQQLMVKRGLLREVRRVELPENSGIVHVVFEEVTTGRERTVIKPEGLTSDLESLAVRGLSRQLNLQREDSPTAA